MKKNLIIIFSSIALIIVLLFCVNLFIKCNVSLFAKFPFDKKQYNLDVSKYETEAIADDFTLLENFEEEMFSKLYNEDRQVFGENYKNKPIVVYGCSYAYGHGIKKEDSFPALLSKLTKRPVYAFTEYGNNGYDNLRHLILYTTKYDDDEEEKTLNIENAEYVIYLYNYDHIVRYISLYTLLDHYDLMFDTSELEKKLGKIESLKILMAKNKIDEALKGYPENDKVDEYFKHHMERIIEKTKDILPNAKFITLIYDETLPAYPTRTNDYIAFVGKRMESPVWNEIANETNSTVVHTKDLTGKVFNNEYRLKEDYVTPPNPNEKPWQIITPLFVKKYIK